jgi:hypothetical protein
MYRTVTIVIRIDPTQYEQAVDTDEGAVDLTIEMLRREADLPNDVTIGG